MTTLAQATESPEVILASYMATFTGYADDGVAAKAVELCADSFTIGDPNDGNGLDALKSVLKTREEAPHTTRHSIGWPIIKQATEMKISGRSIMTVVRIVEDQPGLNVVDLNMTVIKVNGEWKVDNFQIQPFVMAPLG